MPSAASTVDAGDRRFSGGLPDVRDRTQPDSPPLGYRRRGMNQPVAGASRPVTSAADQG